MKRVVLVILSLIMILVMVEVGKTMTINEKHDETKFARKVSVSQILEEKS